MTTETELRAALARLADEEAPPLSGLAVLRAARRRRRNALAAGSAGVAAAAAAVVVLVVVPLGGGPEGGVAVAPLATPSVTEAPAPLPAAAAERYVLGPETHPQADRYVTEITDRTAPDRPAGTLTLTRHPGQDTLPPPPTPLPGTSVVDVDAGGVRAILTEDPQTRYVTAWWVADGGFHVLIGTDGPRGAELFDLVVALVSGQVPRG